MTVININLFNHTRNCYINSANNKSTLFDFDFLLTDAFIFFIIFPPLTFLYTLTSLAIFCQLFIIKIL